MASRLRESINGVRFVCATLHVVLRRTDLTVDEAVREIDMLLRKYGRKA